MTIATAESVPKDRISEAVGYGRSEMEPGRDAWELVERVWMTEGRFRINLPVDPVAIAQDLGIEVLFGDELAPEVSVVARKAPGSVSPQILLNSLDPHDRRRFPCALALGHYSRSVEVDFEGAWEFVEGRDFLSSRDRDPVGSYAIEFASELLMPRSALREFSDTRGVLALAAIFGVTGEVMSFRLGRVGASLR